MSNCCSYTVCHTASWSVISCLAIGMNVVGRWALYGSTSSVAEASSSLSTPEEPNVTVHIPAKSPNMAVNGNGTVVDLLAVNHCSARSTTNLTNLELVFSNVKIKTMSMLENS